MVKAEPAPTGRTRSAPPVPKHLPGLRRRSQPQIRSRRPRRRATRRLHLASPPRQLPRSPHAPRRLPSRPRRPRADRNYRPVGRPGRRARSHAPPAQAPPPPPDPVDLGSNLMKGQIRSLSVLARHESVLLRRYQRSFDFLLSREDPDSPGNYQTNPRPEMGRPSATYSNESEKQEPADPSLKAA
jgi:hypothetical protein